VSEHPPIEDARVDEARLGDATVDATDDDASPNGRAHAARVADVRLTGDRLVVRPPADGERSTNSGLLIPATAAPAPKRLAWADVALVGPDVRVAKIGDRVLYLPQSGLEVELDGEDLVLLRERDVQAVSSPPTSVTERTPGQYL
jgi:chaperonin GroES